MGFFKFWIFVFLVLLIFGTLECWNFGVFRNLQCLVCCFVVCLLVMLCFWYTFVISNVFFRAPKTESDFRCTEKDEFTDY